MPESGSPARYLRQAPKKVSRACSRVGSNTRLLPVLAELADATLRAAGLSRHAHVAAAQDQPVMRIAQEFGRRELHQAVLDLARILARREAGAVRHPEDMRVDRHRRLAEGGVQHHVRRLAADAGQLLERLASRGHLAAVLLDQDAREL